ncbi:hypothetical protein Lal_00027113 [Lupinus albus]|nr:hypothetical protein Lal_00027113 [Lupinus albus]
MPRLVRTPRQEGGSQFSAPSACSKSSGVPKKSTSVLITGIRAPILVPEGEERTTNFNMIVAHVFLVPWKTRFSSCEMRTRSMAQSSDDWEQEREELRTRLDLNEARTNETEELLVAIAAKLGVMNEENPNKGRSEASVGREEWGDKTHHRWRRLEVSHFHRRGHIWVDYQIGALFQIEGMVRRFQPLMIQNPFELLLSLKQEGSVEDYVLEFEKYTGDLKAINHDFVRKIFLDGLKEEVRIKVRLYELETLSEVIQKVVLIEQKNRIVTKKSNNSYANNNKREWSSVGNVVVTSRKTQEATKSRSKTNYKRLTSAKMKEKQEKALCFRCDKLFTRDHVYKNKQLRMILLVEEEDDETEVDVGEGLKSFDSIQLSMYSMTGLTSTKSWKVGEPWGIILGLQLKVGDGHNVRCKGKCAQLKLSMQQLEVIPNFYVFGLKGMDLVLGLKWLTSLGEIES